MLAPGIRVTIREDRTNNDAITGRIHYGMWTLVPGKSPMTS